MRQIIIGLSCGADQARGHPNCRNHGLPVFRYRGTGGCKGIEIQQKRSVPLAPTRQRGWGRGDRHAVIGCLPFLIQQASSGSWRNGHGLQRPPEPVKKSTVGTRCCASATGKPSRTRGTASLPDQVHTANESFSQLPSLPRGRRGQPNSQFFHSCRQYGSLSASEAKAQL